MNLYIVLSNRTIDFSFKTVKDLQLHIYLKERGVPVAHKPKTKLIELCKAGFEVRLESNPDGLLEKKD